MLSTRRRRPSPGPRSAASATTSRNRATGAAVETHRIPELNHLLRHTTGNGSPTGYKRQIKAGLPLDPRVLDALIGWASARLAVAA